MSQTKCNTVAQAVNPVYRRLVDATQIVNPSDQDRASNRCPSIISINKQKYRGLLDILDHILELALTDVRFFEFGGHAWQGFKEAEQKAALDRVIHVLGQRAGVSWRENLQVGCGVGEVRRIACDDTFGTLAPGKGRMERIVSCGFDGLRQGSGRHVAGPQFQLAPFDYFAVGGWFDLQHDSARRGRGFEFFPARDACRPPQIARENDPIRGVKLHNRCHGNNVARLWRDFKLESGAHLCAVKNRRSSPSVSSVQSVVGSLAE